MRRYFGWPAAALLAWAALPVGPADAQLKATEVELGIRVDGDYYWVVTGVEGGKFVARRFRKGDRRTYYKEFRSNGDRMVFGGRAMAWDPDGKSKDVLARGLPVGASGKWVKEGSRIFGTRLRVPSGQLKGMWVGLGPLKEDGEARGYAHLVLVKDKKDAAPFGWADPYSDDGK